MADVALSPVTSCELVYVFSFFEKHHDQFRNNDHDHKKICSTSPSLLILSKVLLERFRTKISVEWKFQLELLLFVHLALRIGKTIRKCHTLFTLHRL